MAERNAPTVTARGWWPDVHIMKMKKRFGCLGVAVAVLTIGSAALWFFTKDMDNFEDDFLNAVYAGDVKKVEGMLNSGETADKQDSYGNNPMTLAAYAGHSEILKILLAHGGKIDRRDNTGMSPLHCAAYYGRLQAAQVLLANGAEVNVTNRYGRTPFSESIGNGFPDVAMLLLNAGASFANRDQRGWQPLHQVLRSNRLEHTIRLQLVIALLDHGADPNAENPGGWEDDSKHDSTMSPFAMFQRRNLNRGNTPLAIAESNGFQDIAELLRKRGAVK